MPLPYSVIGAINPNLRAEFKGSVGFLPLFRQKMPKLDKNIAANPTKIKKTVVLLQIM